MQFLVYIVVLAVSFSTILLELHWLTSSPPQPKTVVASTALPPKAEGPNVELSPVYPKPETPKPAEAPANAKAEPVTPAPVAPVAPAAPAATTAKAETVTEAPAAKIENKIETTGAAVPADIGRQPVVSSATFSSTAQAAPAANAAAKNKCDVAGCAAAYASFQVSDCTYQPFEGPRQVCVKPPAAGQKAASASHAPAVDTRKRARDEELRDVEREVRRVTPRTADIDDEVIVVRRPRW